MADSSPLTLMTVHAHPDDEAIGTGGILAKYAAEGIRTVLVTCTRGELGEVQDPTYAPPRPGMGLTEIRELELARAMEILRIGAYQNLGYKDSGMAGTSGNHDPQAFVQTDVDEAADRLVRLIRKERPQVIVTYDEHGLYGHPDHIMANRITQIAFARAGDAGVAPEAIDPPWQPSKLYYLAIPARRLKKYRDEQERSKRADNAPSTLVTVAEEEITSQIDVTSVLDAKFDAIFAHRSQIAADHLFRRLSSEQRINLFGMEHFICIRGLDARRETKETDLFDGLR